MQHNNSAAAVLQLLRYSVAISASRYGGLLIIRRILIATFCLFVTCGKRKIDNCCI